MSVEKASILNSMKTLLVNDSDLSKYEIFLTGGKSGVLFSDPVLKTEFGLTGTTNPSISSGSAVIICNRATSTPIPNQKIAVKFDMQGPKAFTNAVNGSKIFIEINQTLIDDPTLIEDNYPSTDYALGLNIGIMNMSTSYPVTNSYLPLYTYDGTIWTDVRNSPTVDGKNVDLTDLVGNIVTTGDIEANNIVANGNVSSDDPTLPEHLTTKDYVDALIASFSNETLEKTLTAGEAMSAGQYFRSGISGNFLDIASNGGTVDVGGGLLGIGRDASSQALGVAIPVETSGGLVQVTVSLLKTGTPTSQITMTLYSNLPGVTVVATSTNTISEASLTGSASTQTFTFSNEAIVKGTTYYAKLSVPRANSSTDYTKWVGLSTTPTDMYHIDNTNAWTLFPSARVNYSLTINPGEVNTKKYKAFANKTPFNKVEGVAGNTIVANASFRGVLYGVVGGYIGLTVGEIYYITDTGTISLSPGTTTVKVGRAISTTEINFLPPM